jgi:hypothetical protein
MENNEIARDFTVALLQRVKLPDCNSVELANMTVDLYKQILAALQSKAPPPQNEKLTVWRT